MKGTGNGEPASLDVLPLRPGNDALNGFDRTGDHGLAGTIQINRQNVIVAYDQLRDVLGIGSQGCHGAWHVPSCVGDQATSNFGQLGERSQIENACGVKRHQLTVAMPGHHVGLEPKGFEQTQHANIRGSKGGLSHLRRPQGVVLFLSR
jgi:hypothetical protein